MMNLVQEKSQNKYMIIFILYISLSSGPPISVLGSAKSWIKVSPWSTKAFLVLLLVISVLIKLSNIFSLTFRSLFPHFTVSQTSCGTLRLGLFSEVWLNL